MDLASLNDSQEEEFPTTHIGSSIILIGMPGVGKSTLGVMAAAALGFRYIDLEQCVLTETGLPDARFIAQHSVAEFRAREHALIREALTQYSCGCVMVLLASFIDNPHTVELLTARSSDLSVIHIECEVERILEYVRYNGAHEKGCALVQQKLGQYQRCLNFDYFNLHSVQRDEDSMRLTRVAGGTGVLALKAAEADFVRFLAFVVAGRLATGGPSSCPVPHPEHTPHSCAVQLLFPAAIERELLVSDMTVGADAVEVVVDVSLLLAYGLPPRAVHGYVASVRRACTAPLILTLDLDLTEVGAEALPVWEMYVDLLAAGARLAVEYLTLDLRMARLTPLLSEEQGGALLHQICSARRQTKIIGSYAAGNDAAGFWDSALPHELCELAAELGCDVVRLSKEADTMQDNFAVAAFIERTTWGPQRPGCGGLVRVGGALVEGREDCVRLSSADSASRCHKPPLLVTAFNTGPLGRLSKLFNPFLTPVRASVGSPVLLYAAQAVSEPITVIGQPRCVSAVDLSARELQSALHAAYIAPLLEFYLIGCDLSGSLLTLAHNAAYNVLGLPHHNRRYQTTLMGDIVTLSQTPGFGGCGISLPFKVEAMAYADEISEHGSRIGAINTLVVSVPPGLPRLRPSPRPWLRGDNVDWVAFHKVIQENMSPINAATETKTALVLGGCSLARASIYALISLGYRQIYLHGQEPAKSQALAEHFNSQSPLTFGAPFPHLYHFEVVVLTALDLDQAAPPMELAHPTTIVHCIPKSNGPDGPFSFTVPELWFGLPTGGVYMEAGHEPLCSPVLLRARTFATRGWIVVNVMGFLHAQAVSQFQVHTKKRPPSYAMRQVIAKYLTDSHGLR